MNIQFLTPKIISYSNKADIKRNRPVTSSNLTDLNRDTVSFSGRYSNVGNTLADYMEASLALQTPRLKRIATTYLDVLESVVNKLKDEGFSMDRAYCEKHPVKSPQSYTSKIVRSGKFKVPDTIRATIFCNDLYDLEKLNNKLLPEMEQRGYVVAKTEMPMNDLIKRGFKPNALEAEKSDSIYINVPDLDIRLEDAASQAHKLNPKYRYCIGNPQKSGYEDIQIRFVRDFDKKKAPIQHELIVLFGPEYSSAKHQEYEHVYKHIRNFEKLHASFDDASVNSKKANRYMDLIKLMFRGKVSEKLFLNAKNKDLYGINEELPITFGECDKNLFNSYFRGLRTALSDYYSELKKTASSLVAKRLLAKNAKDDMQILADMQEGLSQTIKRYNYENDIKNLLNANN